MIYLRGAFSAIDKSEKYPKISKDFERRAPEKLDRFKVLKISMQGDPELKSFLVSNYVINGVFTLCCFTSPL